MASVEKIKQYYPFHVYDWVYYTHGVRDDRAINAENDRLGNMCLARIVPRRDYVTR